MTDIHCAGIHHLRDDMVLVFVRARSVIEWSMRECPTFRLSWRIDGPEETVAKCRQLRHRFKRQINALMKRRPNLHSGFLEGDRRLNTSDDRFHSFREFLYCLVRLIQ